MYASNQNEHQDVLTIIASSEKSVEDAITKGLAQLRRAPEHQNIRLRTFQIVSIQGTVRDDGQTCTVERFQVALQVCGGHQSTP